ncbi:MAG TPA: hypothetical protein PK547_00540 [Candidatus Paceibacterota bacterium]|nr:hypothetical protein [Candidatus Paceibacterota bacterium]
MSEQMNEGLISLMIGVSALCFTNKLNLRVAKSMTTIERIEKFEAMEGRSDLKKLYTDSHLKWQVYVPDENPKLSFGVYYKGCRGSKLGVAIFELTPEFFSKYSVFENTEFWEIPERVSLVPIYGVIWSLTTQPQICHCGD